MSNFIASSREMTNRKLRHDRKDFESRIKAQRDTALAANRFDPALPMYLAQRDCSPIARQLLCEPLPKIPTRPTTAICADLLDPHLRTQVRLWRCALATGAAKGQHRVLPHDIEGMLRAIDSPASRLAFALWGKPVVPWRKLSREERAGFLLSEVCKAIRSGLSL